MNRSPRFRLLLASAATAAAIALSGCVTDGTDLSARAMTPLTGKMLSELEQKNMSKDSPILVRIFKQEAELEVWKQDRTGHYALLKTYPICRWSGELGPKIKEGDRQAPEGFYSITPAQMNPKSQYYLAFNMGYPNAYDRAWGRTGAELMIHGDCSSRGCYAMTDEQISEIYALGREAFFGGQRAFQVQAYPFRMTAQNFARHRNNPNLTFWKMLKRGNDHFEVTRLEPKVDVCEKHYVFDAKAQGNFSPSAKCPAYEVPQDILAAVNEKQRTDEVETAELITRGTKTSPIRTGTDGGMHPVFLAALARQDGGPSDSPIRSLGFVSTPGTIPQHAVPPRQPTQTAALTTPAPQPQITTTVARSAPPPTTIASTTPATRTTNGSLFSTIYPTNNARASASPKEATGAIQVAKPAPQHQPQMQPVKQATTPSPAIRPMPPNQTAAAGAIRLKPAVTETPAKTAESERPASTPTNNGSLVQAPASSSTTAMAPAGNFESRWSAITSRGRF